VRDLVRDEPDEEGVVVEDDARQRRRFLAQLARLRRTIAEREAYQRKVRARGRRKPSAKVAERLRRLDERVVRAVCGLELGRRQIERLIEELCRTAERLRPLRRRLPAVVDEATQAVRQEIRDLEGRVGMSAAALERIVRTIRAAENRARTAKQELIEANLRL